jgi:hypothetical protein
MSNVVRIPEGTPLQHVRMLAPEWNGNKHLEKLTWRQIGSTRARRKKAPAHD